MFIAAAVTLVQLMIAPRFDPPARFDHPNANAVVQWKSAEEVHALCHGGAACAFPFKWRPHVGKGLFQRHCIIVAYHGSSRGDAAILRHEVAHCNGWPANHPD